MTYEQFKKQLYYSLIELDQGKQREIGILEKDALYYDESANQVIYTVNLSERRKENAKLQEDIVYAKEGQYSDGDILYWSVRQLYDRYKTEGWQSVLPELATVIFTEEDEQVCKGLSKDSYVRYKSNLIICPISYPLFRNDLMNCIWWQIGEMAFVLCLLVFDDGGNYISMKLERSMTERWRKRDTVLLTGALLNCYAKMPPRLFRGQDFLDYYDDRGGVFMPDEEGIPIRIDPKDAMQGSVGYRLTTCKRVNGAIALFYPGVKERLAELLEDDYYVGFQSVNEVSIYPVRQKRLSDVRAAICHSNALLEKRSKLTSVIYKYVALRGELMEV